MIAATDIHWIAGLLEGEGCFTSTTRSRGLQVALATTDKDVVYRYAALVGCDRVATSANGGRGRKLIHDARLGGPRAAGLMMTVYPLMGCRRKEKIRELLARWRSSSRLPRQINRVPVCHPDRRHHSKMMCRPCYKSAASVRSVA